MGFNKSTSISSAKKALALESIAIKNLSDSVPKDFSNFIEKIFHLEGRIIISGVGKSGHIGKKIASTLASTGTPSFFIHSTEASHGDLGMIQPGDICLLISNSGEAKELFDILQYIKNFSIPLAAISSNPESTLVKAADYKLLIPKCEEICPLGMAPTTSAIVTLALGDAIAVSIMEQKNFSCSDYKIFHPGGKLGTKMLQAKDLMHTGKKIPIVSRDESMKEVLIEMTTKSFGIAAVCYGNFLTGVISDGDLRRNIDGLLEKTAQEIASKSPQTISVDTFAIEALQIMNSNQISVLIVVDAQNSPVGIIHMHDLVRAGIT